MVDPQQLKKEICELKEKLGRMLNVDNVTTDDILRMSKELDQLVYAYLKDNCGRRKSDDTDSADEDGEKNTCSGAGD